MFFEGKALEFLIAAVVALVVVGPKDLPILLRKFGQFMARVRSMAAEFRASFDEMARQSELDELRKEVEAMRKGQLGDLAQHTTSPEMTQIFVATRRCVASPEMTQTFNEISQGLSDVGVSLNEPVTYPYTPAQTEHVDISPVETPKPKARKAPAKAKATTTKAAAAKAATAKTAPAKRASAKRALAKAPTVEGGPKAAAAKASVKAAPKPRARKATVS